MTNVTICGGEFALMTVIHDRGDGKGEEIRYIRCQPHGSDYGWFESDGTNWMAVRLFVGRLLEQDYRGILYETR